MQFCGKCGTQIVDGARFCKNCGDPVPAETAAQTVRQGQEQGPVYAAAPVNNQPDMADASTFSTASGQNLQYVVLQVTLKEKFIGTGSGNLAALEACINAQAAKGYRLHTITTATGNSTGFLCGARIQATMVFERII